MLAPSRLAALSAVMLLAGCASGGPAAIAQPAGPETSVDTAPEAVVGYALRGQAASLAAALRAGGDPDARAEVEDEAGDVLTALMAAASRDRAEAMAVLIDAGASLEATDEAGRTALHWAAMRHAPGAARLLLEAGAARDALDGDGTRPLGWAAFSGATEVAAILLDAGADVNASGESWSALIRAIKTYGDTYGGADMVALLLARGAAPDLPDDRGRSPLHRAVSDSPGAFAVTALLLDAGADPAVRDADGNGPATLASQRNATRLAALYAGDPTATAQATLYTAIARGDASAITAAIASGADPNAGTKGNDFFSASFIDDGGPVHLAARVGASPQVIAALTAGGADLDAVTSAGSPPLKIASDKGDLATVQALLAAGASPESTTDRPFLGMEPIHWAAAGGHADVVQALIDAGADPSYSTNASMGYGYNALGLAIHHGHAGAVRVLLDAGMTTEHVGENPHTALDLADVRQWPAIGQILRQRGAKTTVEMAQDHVRAMLAESGAEAAWRQVLIDGDTPAMRALLALSHAPPADAIRESVFSLQDDPDLASALAEAGAEVNLAGYSGMTALHLAAADGLGPLVSALLDAGADRDLVDDEGKTALDWALEYDDPETVALLSDDDM